jgi:probable rRNA maturation factor
VSVAGQTALVIMSSTRGGSRRASSQTDPLPEVALQNSHRFQNLETAALRTWLQKVLTEVIPEAESFGVRFVSDAEMAEFNFRYRSKEGPTDVLSFPGDASCEEHHLGDVVIAVPCARRQAQAQDVPFDREVRALLLHGVLHCLGYDHESDDGEMGEIEKQLGRRWISDVD